MSAMLGVIETSLAGSPMKVLHLEHAGRRPVPTSSFSQTAAQRPQNRRFAGVPKEPKSRDLHHTFTGAEIFLGGLRRSFAASPWCKLDMVRVSVDSLLSTTR